MRKWRVQIAGVVVLNCDIEASISGRGLTTLRPGQFEEVAGSIAIPPLCLAEIV